MNHKRTRLALIAGIAAAGLFGLGSASAADKGTIKIVTHSPLSGPNSPSGESIKLGAQLALEDYGKLLTSQGFKVQLQPEDDQANPNVGVANANRLINDPDILAVVGHYNSGVFIPSSEVYAKANLVAVSPANTNPQVTDRESTRAIANRICGRDDVQGPVGADFAVKDLKAKKVYVINDKTAYGAGVADAFEAAVKKAGVKVMLASGVDDKETDFSSVLNRAAIDKPDIIYFGGYYQQGGLLLKQMRQKKVGAVFMGGDGLDSGDLQKIAGSENVTKAYFTTLGVPLSKLPAAKKFAEVYKTKFNKDPEAYSAYGYDSMRVVLQAIADSAKANGGNKPSREQVAAAVRKVKFDGLTGKISFNSRGDIEVAKYVVVGVGPTPDKNDVKSIIEKKAPNS
ncbi:MAG: branched-chain amino acid ABC transporter substrate-binding protein [Gammaproteobacteria bacterium]|nr:branched-chain amino acid ABC transporter substrate-binding protein [Gammaproteobacteria bacterium]